MAGNSKKILFVCLGNICRSPVAEGVMRMKATHYGLKNIFIDSAGTAGYHIGEAPDKRTISNAQKNGLDISGLRARKITTNDLDLYDTIYTMDENNRQNVIALCINDIQKQKVKLILNEVNPSQNKAIPDPYYGTEKDFQLVYDLLNEACEKIALDLVRESKAALKKV